MEIKLDISRDYTVGQIAFDCQSIDDVRKIGDILSIVGFNMRFANIEIKDKPMENKNLLDQMVAHINELEKTADNLKSLYNSTEMPQYIDFIVSHITENIAPGLRGFISQAKTMEMLREGEEHGKA
jgi:hypothetical protein